MKERCPQVNRPGRVNGEFAPIPCSAQARCDLIHRVAQWCYDHTESWEGIGGGTGLAYLFWAIAANDGQPFDTTVYPEQYAELIKILKSNPNGLWDELVAIRAIA